MTKVVLAACLLVACSLAMGKDPTPLPLGKGARVGVVDMMDPEVTHFHTGKVLAQSFLKTQLVAWPVDSMVGDAVNPRLTQLQLAPIALGPSDLLMRNRDEFFVNNSVAKGLSRECAKEFAQLAAAEHLDALIVFAPGLNNSSQAGSAVRRALPDYLRGWGFVTSTDGSEKTTLFNMTQILLISIGPDGATLRAREWGGGYADEWPDYTLPPDPKVIPPDQMDKLQPMFAKILGRQAGRLMEWVIVP
jgi:hypothetical protein